MKATALILFISTLIISCNTNGNYVTQKADTVNSRIEKLKESYEQDDYLTFFTFFPDSFIELVYFYDYRDESSKDGLYSLYESHINYFFKYEGKISSRFFLEKAFNIGKNGVWDADGVGLFQSNITKLIIKKPNTLLEVIKSKPEKEVIGFWFFIFDGSGKHDLQNNETFESIYDRINTLDKKQGKLIKQEFERIYR